MNVWLNPFSQKAKRCNERLEILCSTVTTSNCRGTYVPGYAHRDRVHRKSASRSYRAKLRYRSAGNEVNYTHVVNISVRKAQVCFTIEEYPKFDWTDEIARRRNINNQSWSKTLRRGKTKPRYFERCIMLLVPVRNKKDLTAGQGCFVARRLLR